MALARFKDLCIDAVDPHVLGRFWAAALRLDLEHLDDGDACLRGPTPQHTIWVNRVPEPPAVKQRIHFDLHVARVSDIVDLGASLVDNTSFAWTVLRDPEGGELCVFEREQIPPYRLREVIVDCHDPETLANWWASLLGARVGQVPEHGVHYVDEIPGAPFENLVFVPVPEAKSVKNRIHPDLVCADTDAVADHGATLLRARDDGPGGTDWSVLADPEGNEFCAFLPADG